jgi:hypothetical protein
MPWSEFRSGHVKSGHYIGELPLCGAEALCGVLLITKKTWFVCVCPLLRGWTGSEKIVHST